MRVQKSVNNLINKTIREYNSKEFDGSFFSIPSPAHVAGKQNHANTSFIITHWVSGEVGKKTSSYQ